MRNLSDADHIAQINQNIDRLLHELRQQQALKAQFEERQRWHASVQRRETLFRQARPRILEKWFGLRLPQEAENTALSTPETPPQFSLSEQETKLLAAAVQNHIDRTDDWLNSRRIAVPVPVIVEMSPKQPIISTFNYNPTSHPATWLDKAITNHRSWLKSETALPDLVQGTTETWLNLLAQGQPLRYPEIKIQVDETLEANEIRCFSYLKDQ